MSQQAAQTSFNPNIVNKPPPVKFHGGLYEMLETVFQGGDLASGSFTYNNDSGDTLWISKLWVAPDASTSPTVSIQIAGTYLTKKQVGTNTGTSNNPTTLTLPQLALDVEAQTENQEFPLPAGKTIVITQGGTGGLHFFIRMTKGVNQVGLVS
jgi:hypothetical protein